MTNNIMELTKLTKLFDMTKINVCAPKGEKMFKYGDYADKSIQSAIETLGEHQTIGDIISFALAVADFEEHYRTKHEGDDAFTYDYNRDEHLTQMFLSMHSEWSKRQLSGDKDAYFCTYVYRRLAEMQDLVDNGDCVVCGRCGSVIDKYDTFYFRGKPYCGHCSQLIAVK